MKLVSTKNPQEMFEVDYDIMLTTTNSTLVNQNGQWVLVMGGGHAKQVRDIMPDLPQRFANYLIDKSGLDYQLSVMTRCYYPYGIIANPKVKFGAFQTKDWVHQDSKLELIRYSTNKLIEFVKSNPKLTILLPFPGVGLGNLKKEDVLPIINNLPDNIIVYELIRR